MKACCSACTQNRKRGCTTPCGLCLLFPRGSAPSCKSQVCPECLPVSTTTAITATISWSRITRKRTILVSAVSWRVCFLVACFIPQTDLVCSSAASVLQLVHPGFRHRASSNTAEPTILHGKGDTARTQGMIKDVGLLRRELGRCFSCVQTLDKNQPSLTPIRMFRVPAGCEVPCQA